MEKPPTTAHELALETARGMIWWGFERAMVTAKFRADAAQKRKEGAARTAEALEWVARRLEN